MATLAESFLADLEDLDEDEPEQESGSEEEAAEADDGVSAPSGEGGRPVPVGGPDAA